MDNLISRRVAIDAIQRIGRLATLPDNDAVIRMSAVEYVLYNLPSAQPERTQERTETHACDCISRQAALDECLELAEARRNWGTEEGQAEIRGIDAVMCALHDLPSAQPEHKHGKWVLVRDEEAGNALYMCSECGKGDIHAPEVRASYCWNCGAQMER